LNLVARLTWMCLVRGRRENPVIAGDMGRGGEVRWPLRGCPAEGEQRGEAQCGCRGEHGEGAWGI